MKKGTTNAPANVADEKLYDNWFDPIETELQAKLRDFIEAMIEQEPATGLARRGIISACGATPKWLSALGTSGC